MPAADGAPTEPPEPPKLPGWRSISNPWTLFDDADIADACRGVQGALTVERDGFVLLAVPVGADEPFPMMPIFCFGEPEMIEGRGYVVFKTQNGNLAI